MFLFLQNQNYDSPLPVFLLITGIIISFLLLIGRGFYVLFNFTPKRTFIYLGIVFGIFLIIWFTFLFAKSKVFALICLFFTVPFGFIAGMPFLIFGPPIPLALFAAAFLNLVAICGVIEFIEKIFAKIRLSSN